MTNSLIWISGASSGVGRALAESVPWEDSRVINISRRDLPGTEHLAADLADPSSWPAVGESFRTELAGFAGHRVVFFHCAGTVDPLGFAAELDPQPYAANVVLNSAAPQALGQLFVAAAAEVEADRFLVMMTSGAAKSVYPGWSSYGAGKAAVDQWVRNVGAEQQDRGGVRLISVGPGTVDTGMQAALREAPERQFPSRRKFVDLHQDGKLTDPRDTARALWGLLEHDLDNGAVVDLRNLTSPAK